MCLRPLMFHRVNCTPEFPFPNEAKNIIHKCVEQSEIICQTRGHYDSMNIQI